jgi:hypothetical protein
MGRREVSAIHSRIVHACALCGYRIAPDDVCSHCTDPRTQTLNARLAALEAAGDAMAEAIDDEGEPVRDGAYPPGVVAYWERIEAATAAWRKARGL